MVLPFFYIDPMMMGGMSDPAMMYGGYGGGYAGYPMSPYTMGGYGHQQGSSGNSLLSGIFTAVGLGVGLAISKNRNKNPIHPYDNNFYHPGSYGGPFGYNNYLWI